MNHWLLHHVGLRMTVLSVLVTVGSSPDFLRLSSNDTESLSAFFMDRISETDSECDSTSPTHSESQKYCPLTDPLVPGITPLEDLHHPHFEDVQHEIQRLLTQDTTIDLLAVREFLF